MIRKGFSGDGEVSNCLTQKRSPKRTGIFLFAAIAWLAWTANGLAVERFVPYGGALNYSNIQTAINASLEGDVVRVQPGTYRESITFPNVNITLTSMNPSDSNVVQTTIIQGNGTNSVVSFTSGQTSNTLLTGFTIRGGGGTVYSSYYLLGGGIYCYQSSPSIVGNIIEENHVPTNLTNLYSLGGGVSCWYGGPRIARNVIRNNSAILGGAILSLGSKPLIQDNWIYHNTAPGGGAAAYLADQGKFLNNTLLENTPNHLDVSETGLVANNIIADFNAGTGVIASGTLSWFQYNDVWEPAGVEILLIVDTGTNTISVPTSMAGTNGNISVDPLFVNATNLDLNLFAASVCINAGDPFGLRSTNELDIAGGPRIFALRVDIGASEFRGDRNFPPMANAGVDQRINWRAGETVTLDGSGSIDPDGSSLIFNWVQTSGPSVSLLLTNSQAIFTPTGLGEYRFELVVNDGVYDSPPDEVRVVVNNLPPIASAGLGQSLPTVPEALVLDGSHSLDPEGSTLSYRWRQTAGPFVPLTTPRSPRFVIRPPGPGMYEFELVVNDEFTASPPDSVKFYLGQCLPVADAGGTRYAGRDDIILDGSRSFVPNSSAPLQYSWRKVSGPPLTLSPTNVAKPIVSGFAQMETNREAVFELVVSAGGLTSVPSRIKMIIVPRWYTSAVITNVNPPFNTNRPTIFGFGGGDGVKGHLLKYPTNWYDVANLFDGHFAPDSGDPPYRYYGYGDQFIVILSALAPNYDQPMQTVGFSTGGMPACDAAERLNLGYKDPRYLVNRITFMDPCCRNYTANIRNLTSNRIPGTTCWVDNYYAVNSYQPGALNVEFPVPPAEHNTPHVWYFPSWTIGTPYQETNFNNGVYAGSFFSVVGPGKNYQLATDQSEYYFGWNPPTDTFLPNTLVQMSPALCPAKLPGVVELNGPTNDTIAPEHSVVFSCLPTLNAVKYQILVGPDARHVDYVVWEGDSPPNQSLPKLPFARTWWKIRVADAWGTTSWSDPRYVSRDSDVDGLSDEAEVLTYHTDPDRADPVLLTAPVVLPNGGFSLTLSNGFGRNVIVQASTNLANWVTITNFVNLQQAIQILDATTPKPPARFYRAQPGQ